MSRTLFSSYRLVHLCSSHRSNFKTFLPWTTNISQKRWHIAHHHMITALGFRESDRLGCTVWGLLCYIGCEQHDIMVLGVYEGSPRNNRKSVYRSEGTMCKRDYHRIMTTRHCAIWTHSIENAEYNEFAEKKADEKDKMCDGCLCI